MVITPPQAQLQVERLVKAGKTPILALIAPGFQGPKGTGIQGMGVNTPAAAEVAAATAGLAREVHIPKGAILVTGIKSMMVAAKVAPAILGGPWGTTMRVLGAIPQGIHWRVAPIETCCGMVVLLACV
jgi:hypothetical protein